MKKALIIDIQNTAEENFPNNNREFYLREILKREIPAIIALTPYQRTQWRDLGELIGEIASRNGSHLFLEGLIHTCNRNHRIRDPHHEGICTSLLRTNAGLEEQESRIGDGIKFLKAAIGVTPTGFIPPQHLWNKNTAEAVFENGLDYLVTNSVLIRHPYSTKTSDLTIVPSGSTKRGVVESSVVHFYYDRIMQQKEIFEEISKETTSLEDLPEVQTNGAYLKNFANQLAIRGIKQLRDLHRLIEGNRTEEGLYERRFEEFNGHWKELFREDYHI